MDKGQEPNVVKQQAGVVCAITDSNGLLDLTAFGRQKGHHISSIFLVRL